MAAITPDFVFAPLETASATPLYRQLQHNLRVMLNKRALKPEDALPNERLIAERLAVSRVTVRKAIEGLVDEGLLERRQGAGTFVSKRIEKSFSKLSSFTEDMAARGRTSSSRFILRQMGPASPEEAFVFGLSQGHSICRFQRLRFADDVPLAVEHTSVPSELIGSSLDIGPSLYEELERHGNRPKRALQRLRAVAFDARVAGLLGVETGSPGLMIERRGFLQSGKAVEYTTSHYRGDAYDFVAELSFDEEEVKGGGGI